jgi:acyl dehydratase
MIEWFDDLTLGMRFKSGEVSVTKEDIKRFAAEFDPRPFHLDEVAAEKTAFNGLAASAMAHGRYRDESFRSSPAIRAAPINGTWCR